MAAAAAASSVGPEDVAGAQLTEDVLHRSHRGR